jgi:aminopeptidase-like protein
LATFLGRLLQNKNNRFTYRIVFVPETIGPVIYMSKNLDHMKRKTLAGFILTCVGDDRAFSFMPSRHGNTIADHLARQTLEKYAPDYVAYNYLQDRASDERQYCSPGADLPVVSMMRTAYGRYPEYHTSLDDLSVISPEGFAKSIYLHSKTISKIEHLRVWQATNIGEPQLSRRAYRSTIGGQREPLPTEMRLISNILAMADGVIDTSTLAHLIDHPESEIDKWCEKLAEDGLLCQVY